MLEGSKLWASVEIARIHATGVRTATAKTPFQVVSRLVYAMKVKRLFPGRLLHSKREIALHIDDPFERIRSSGTRPERKRSSQDATALALPDKHRDARGLLRYLIRH